MPKGLQIVGSDSAQRVRPQTTEGASTATVSVIVPCHNYGRFLPDAVTSVLDQTGVSVDVVVVDDASTDDSAAVARSLAARDDRVRLLAHAANMGPVTTFNDGLALVTGEFVVRLDADDLLTPGSLHRSVEVMRAYPRVGLVYGHPIHFEGERRASPREVVRSWTIWPGHDWLAARCRSGLNVITSPEVVMRRSVVSRVGGQAALAHTHDMEMWLRLAAFADVAHIEGADQAWHRDHDLSLSARKVDLMTDLVGRFDAFETLFSGVAAEVIEVTTLRPTVRRVLAAEALEDACHYLDRGRASAALIADLVEFARMSWPELDSLPPWSALCRRRSCVDPSRNPRFVAQAVRRRVRNELRYRHWSRWGVYTND